MRVVTEQASRAESSSTSDKGTSSPLGATIVPGGVNFSVFSGGGDLLLFDHEDDARPARAISLDLKQPLLPLLARFVPDLQAGRMAIALVGRSILQTGCGLILGRFASRTDEASRFPLQPWCATRRLQHVDRHEERRRRYRCLRLGRRHTTTSTILPDDHLRNASSWFHPPPQLGHCRQAPRYIRGANREDPLPPATRDYSDRTTTGFSIRCSGCAAGTD